MFTFAFRKKALTIIVLSSLFIHSVYSKMTIQKKNESSMCFIRNIKYTDEYLYSSNDFDSLDKDTSLTTSIFDKQRIFVNEMSPKHISSIRQSIWLFQPVEIMTSDNKIKNRTFLIGNAHFKNHILCASSDHLDRFNQRRLVNLNRLNDEIKILKGLSKCVWILDKVNPNSVNSNDFMITNMKYKEKLYAASYLFKTSRTKRRNVFLWHKKPDSTQFVWNVNCLINKDIFNLYASLF
jgi:hypothetical protein